MKSAYKWFDIVLNAVLIGPIIASLPILYFWINSQNGINNQRYEALLSYNTKIAYINGFLILSLFLGLFYSLIGIILLSLTSKRKNKTTVNNAKRMIIKGIIRALVAYIFFFILSLIFSYFGLSMPTCLCLPTIPN